MRTEFDMKESDIPAESTADKDKVQEKPVEDAGISSKDQATTSTTSATGSESEAKSESSKSVTKSKTKLKTPKSKQSKEVPTLLLPAPKATSATVTPAPKTTPAAATQAPKASVAPVYVNRTFLRTILFPFIKLGSFMRHNPVAHGFGRVGFILLRGAILLVALYLLLMPILPSVIFYFKQVSGQFEYDRQKTHTEVTNSGDDSGYSDGKTIPQDDRLLIPAIGLDINIVEGKTESALERGAWRRPKTSTPDQGGNTVITGHRFKYLPPNNLTFYNLDKVKVGDKVTVYWKGVEYKYTVEKTFVVEPSQIEVEDNTEEPQLTLYTCTPLWTAKQRLVIVAKPVQ